MIMKLNGTQNYIPSPTLETRRRFVQKASRIFVDSDGSQYVIHIHYKDEYICLPLIILSEIEEDFEEVITNYCSSLDRRPLASVLSNGCLAIFTGSAMIVFDDGLPIELKHLMFLDSLTLIGPNDSSFDSRIEDYIDELRERNEPETSEFGYALKFRSFDRFLPVGWFTELFTPVKLSHRLSRFENEREPKVEYKARVLEKLERLGFSTEMMVSCLLRFCFVSAIEPPKIALDIHNSSWKNEEILLIEKDLRRMFQEDWLFGISKFLLTRFLVSRLDVLQHLDNRNKSSALEDIFNWISTNKKMTFMRLGTDVVQRLVYTDKSIVKKSFF